MYPFAYAIPSTVEDARRILKAQSEARPLAGGMSLIPAMKLRMNRPSHLVDLRKLGLDTIRQEGSVLVVGAMATHAAVAASPVVRKLIPALGSLAGGIGDRQVRNRGTIGGSVANNDPSACWPAALVALGATIITTDGSVYAEDFFRGLFETSLGDGELVLAVRFPIPKRAAYVKFAQQASGFALVGVMVAQDDKGNARVGVTGAKSCAYRETKIEQQLDQHWSASAVRGVALTDDEYNDDLHASSEYRRSLVVEIAARAAELAIAPSTSV